MGIANIAATFMEHLCTCPDHGYSQEQRWGDRSLGICFPECEGKRGTFFKGDRDCSSAVIDAWQEALIGTEFEGALKGATYTGNMRDVFVSSGLFEWHDMSFIAQRGDIYLDQDAHTAMCTSPNPDMLAEFSIDENGGIKGGKPGDQTGRESLIRPYYADHWDGILHYNGKADPDVLPEPEEPKDEFMPVQPSYRAKVDGRWLPAMDGKKDLGGSSDDYAGILGKRIDAFEIASPNNFFMEIHEKDGDWIRVISKNNIDGVRCWSE